MSDTATDTTPPAPAREGGIRRKSAPRPVHPMLQTLFELYPRLFGARFLPLKLGVFEDMVTAHPDKLKREDLKVALGLHTRSNRYLEAVASGLPRHDLQAAVVEPVAPEHVHHAILELYRRKNGRPGGESAHGKAVAQLVAAIESSGLGRDGYRERFGSQDPALQALVDEAVATVAQQAAKGEALLRAFEASGKTEAEFADMYGMSATEVSATLARARSSATAP